MPGWDPRQDAAGPEARRQRLQRYVTWTAEDLAELNVALRAQRVQDEPSRRRQESAP